MPHRRIALVCLVLPATALAGCSSGGAKVQSAATPPPTAASHPPGGFIGMIDAARVASVCANARAAETMQSGQVGGSAVSDPLIAAAGVLERPPVDPTAARAAATIRLELRRGHPALAVATALAFCRAHGA